MKRIISFITVAGVFSAHFSLEEARAQGCTDLYNPAQVLSLNVEMDPLDWETLRVSCPDGVCDPPPHFYFPAFLTCGELGPIFVGIRRKNDIAEPSEADPQKVSLKIDINRFIPGQTFAGKKKLSLENGSDEALVTEGLAWNIYGKAGFVVGRSAWVNVFVNGELKGLYANVEQIDKTFLADHGLNDSGFLFKVHEQRTRELETNPFAFNWYPFDHITGIPEDPPPADWRDQSAARVDIPNLLKFAAAENLIANTDGTVIKMVNYWYYDWSILPGDDPSGQQPRLYLPWDLDTTLKSIQTQMPILDSGNGHLQQGLIEELDESGAPLAEPSFQAAYRSIYQQLLASSLSLAELVTMVDQIEAVVAPHMDADPYQTTGSAADEFQRIRDFFQARTAFVQSELNDCPADADPDGDGIGVSCDNCDLFNPAQLDCQPNGTGDVCDIASGSSADTNGDGVPDECACVIVPFGDVNHDLAVDLDDLNCLLAQFSGQAACAGVLPLDLDLHPCIGDGELNLHDLLSLLDALAGVPACADPCR